MGEVARERYDVVVVGSGFGGSVAALRLAEKGYAVAVLEAGRRFDDNSLPASSWDVRRFVWAPRLGLFGIQRTHLLPNLVVLGGAGVGGGSLNYANTLYEPPEAFFDDPQWSAVADWRAVLAPYYDQAKRVLGATANPLLTAADDLLAQVANEMGAGETFSPADVGVFFGRQGVAPGTAVPDPFFGGAGPARRTCVHCGECMTGCRRGAKNTLLTNYLYLAERAGAAVVPMTTVTALEPVEGGWRVGGRRTGWRAGARGGGQREFSCGQVVLAAGTYGTQRLLHSMVLSGRLPHISPRLGELTRTNSESLLGATVPRGRARPDFSRGVAITSSFYPEPGTHVEPVRYGRGSNLMGLLGTLLFDTPPSGVNGAGGWQGLARLLGAAARHPGKVLRSLDVREWSERTVIALVMQSHDNSLTLFAKRGLLGGPRLSSRQDEGSPNPTWIPIGHEVVRRLAGKVGGAPARTWGEVLGVPMTAHFLGGCAIGASEATGVVDPWHRVYGYPGLHIVDGSAVPANPGVNPALTITALAERAFSYWPNKGDPDPRPPLAAGAPPVVPGLVAGVPVVAPRSPAVPKGAQGELRL